MKYEAVFLDLDGTVIDSLQDIVDAVNYTMGHFGLRQFSRDELRPKLGWGVSTLMKLALPGTSEARREELLAFYKPYYAVHAGDHSRPFEGILPMLRAMRDAGLVLAILSNKPDAAVQPLAEKYFADVVALSVGERPEITRKPAPDMLIKAAKDLNVDINRCLYVGDSEVDIDTAKNTGIDCACVTWGFRTREELEAFKPLAVIDTTQELERIILG